MPNHKSAEKRVRQNEKRRVINRGHRTKVRTYIKKVRAALESGSAEQVGDIIAFLASDEASPISGTEMWIDGAQSLLQG